MGISGSGLTVNNTGTTLTEANTKVGTKGLNTYVGDIAVGKLDANQVVVWSKTANPSAPSANNTATIKLDGTTGKITASSLKVEDIEAGSVNSDWVYTGSVNADQITSGFMSADRIAGGTLNIGGNWKWDSGGIQVYGDGQDGTKWYDGISGELAFMRNQLDQMTLYFVKGIVVGYKNT